MAKADNLLGKSVTKNTDGGYDFTCPVNDGSCGSKATDDKPAGSFTSTGWPTRDAAEARAQEHFDDHKGIEPMSSLDDFRDKHGLSPSGDGLTAVVSAKDL